MDLHRIIVEVDGSPESFAAVEWCAEHAGADDEVVAVAAMSLVGQLALTMPPSDLSYWQEGTRAALEGSMTAPLRRHHVRYRTRIESGTPWKCIIDAAENEHADAIVLGRHHSRLAEMLSGAGTNKVVQRSTVPVIIVPFIEDAAEPAA